MKAVEKHSDGTLVVNGRRFVTNEVAAHTLGISPKHLINVRDEDLMNIRYRFRGRVYFEERGLQVYMEGELQKVI
tara:strand:- start:108 stop:332 length:225 start_codon:yes stop_codon:yes gene_type:complete